MSNDEHVLGSVDFYACRGCENNESWKQDGETRRGCPDIITDGDVDWPSGTVTCRARVLQKGGRR